MFINLKPKQKQNPSCIEPFLRKSTEKKTISATDKEMPEYEKEDYLKVFSPLQSLGGL